MGNAARITGHYPGLFDRLGSTLTGWLPTARHDVILIAREQSNPLRVAVGYDRGQRLVRRFEAFDVEDISKEIDLIQRKVYHLYVLT